VPNYCAYFRVSTENQGKSGLGLQAQQEAVQRFLKEGDSIAAQFTEVESGKRHQNRPQLAAALDYCRQRGCVLLIATLDRLARNVHFISGLMETNVPFLAADRPTATAFEIHIYAAMAEEERRKISQRVKVALAVKRAALAKEGKKLGNPRPLEALKLAVAAKRQAITTTPEVLKLIADRHREQKSLRTIANELNCLGIRTGRGKRWYASSINLQLNRVRRMAREEAVNRQVSVPLPVPEPPQHTRALNQDGVPMTPLEAAASVVRRLAQVRR
jgi:DNA invertase Pin-like site-specific DNA recombinase